MVGNSVPQVIQLSSIFLEQFNQNCDTAHKAIQKQDYETLAKLAHKMKPSFKLFNLNQSAQICQEIENAFEAVNYMAIDQLFTQILNNQFSIADQVKFALEKAQNNQTLQ